LVDVAVRLTQLTKRFGGDATGRRVARYVDGATPGDSVLAVDHIDLEVRDREFFSLLGPSGCGKTTTLRMIGGFEQPSSGVIELQGHDVTWLPPYQRNVNTVFQNYALFPHLTVFDNVAFGLRRKKVSDTEVKARVAEILRIVELPGYERRKPGQLSGGQAQRVAIARALTLDPALIICDEAVSSLDVLIQAQVLNLFERLRAELGLSYLFIAHDLALVKQVSDRVAVMYLGRLCELGPAEALYREPFHPYTVALLASIPSPDPEAPRAQAHAAISGDPPSPIDPPSGCRFRTRCPRAQERCAVEVPEMRELAPDHAVACHFPVERGTTGSP
jgi:oligopeptide/dipeptide ABC transporter ATP-binding protein